jgi:exopolysaccharide biosynthesis polyprenyl glycosylphosphotransferase
VVERLGRRLTGSVLLWDTLLMLLVLYLASFVPPGGLLWSASPSRAALGWQVYAAAAASWISVFLILRPQRALFFNAVLDAFSRLVAAILLASLVFGGLLFLAEIPLLRVQWLFFTGTNLVLLFMFHCVIRFNIRVRDRYRGRRRTLIVGSASEAQPLIQEFARRPWVGLQVVGYATDEQGSWGNLPVFGPVDATIRIVQEQHIDEVVFVTEARETIVRLSLQLLQHPVMLHMAPGAFDLAFARTPVETVGGIPLISLRESALTESERVLKRLFDLVASCLLLLICAPLLIAIAVAIRLDSAGPVLFRQERIGEHGRRFKMYKFRSMARDAEERWAEVAQREADGSLLHKHADDPRVTRIGYWLRRTSLDELPQLFNVLKGEMSLVGPRPELPYLAAEYEPWQWQRVRVPAGLTGWWQVNGRSGKPMHLHTEDDLYYIQNYSLWLDMKILWMTVPAVLKGRGAF